MDKPRFNYQLYLVTDEKILEGRAYVKTLEEALHGGVSLVQLREKELSARAFYHRAVEVHQLTQRHGVPLIVNDRVDIALAMGAEGVHVGQQDLPVSAVRQVVGHGMVIGASAATLEEALRAEEEGADYIGVGALFPTRTKTNTRPVTLDQLKAIKQAVGIPVVAIGGIGKENVSSVIQQGVDGVAVVSAVLQQKSPQNAASALTQIIGEARRKSL